MKNKKFVATLLHACTLYCVSAYNVQEYPVARNEFREYPGQIASERSSEEIATSRQATGTLIPIDRQGTGLSPEIRHLLKACSIGKASFLFKPLFSRSLSFSGAAFPELNLPMCAHNAWQVPAYILPFSPVQYFFCTGSEGNATWIEYCLTNGP